MVLRVPRLRWALLVSAFVLLSSVGCVGGPIADPGQGSDRATYELDTVRVVQNGSGSPLAFDATVVDGRVSAGDPAAIELAVTNEGDGRLWLSTGPLPPFGAVVARPGDGSKTENGIVLWRDAYADGDEVDVVNGTVAEAALETGRPLASGNTAAQTFEINASAAREGSFTIVESIGYETHSGDAETAQFEVSFELRRTDG